MKKLLVILLLCSSGSTMAYMFWTQELQYVRPTPVPEHYNPVAVRQTVNLHRYIEFGADSAIYLHFFNPDCPCSRFNLNHFNTLVRNFGKQVHVCAVIPAYADLQRAKEMIANDGITIIQDTDNTITNACGVYSTPQAVVIDAQQKLFYRGNYNKSRYCTTRDSNYAEIALTALVKGEQPPYFNALATQAYGCQIPTNQ